MEKITTNFKAVLKLRFRTSWGNLEIRCEVYFGIRKPVCKGPRIDFPYNDVEYEKIQVTLNLIV